MLFQSSRRLVSLKHGQMITPSIRTLMPPRLSTVILSLLFALTPLTTKVSFKFFSFFLFLFSFFFFFYFFFFFFFFFNIFYSLLFFTDKLSLLPPPISHLPPPTSLLHHPLRTGFHVSFAAGALIPNLACAGGGSFPGSGGCYKTSFVVPKTDEGVRNF